VHVRPAATERGEATRQRLLAAAAAVFSERGYAGATTREIAESAGVAEGTIYRHFSGKDELFRAVFAEMSATSAEELLRLPELAGKHTVRENLARLITVIEDFEEHVAPLQASMWSDAELVEALAGATAAGEKEGVPGPLPSGPPEPLVRYLEAEQELGRVREDLDPERAAFALFAIPFASVITARLSGATGSAARGDMMGALDVVLRGLEPGAVAS
jgi:AcrR family transcriptional regulator